MLHKIVKIWFEYLEIECMNYLQALSISPAVDSGQMISV